MAPQRVRYEVEDDVAVVTLARPDKRNALDAGAFAALHDAAARAAAGAASGEVRAVLLLGEGLDFCAGIDVALLAGQVGDVPTDDWIADLQQAFTGFEDLPVPTVAAVHGASLGAGCQLALAAHLRVAAPDASFGLLEARWGLIPDLGATYRLPRLVGLSRAVDLAVSGRRVDAATALAWGLVDAVLEGDDFPARSRAYVARLAAGPTLATGAVPALMRASLGTDDRGAVLAAERSAQARCLASTDFAEAVRAASAREHPTFRGR